MIFDLKKKPEIDKGKKKASSTNNVGLTGYLYVEKPQVDPYLFSWTKFKFKCMKDFNIKLNTLNLMQEKVMNIHDHIGTVDKFLKRTPVAFLCHCLEGQDSVAVQPRALG